MLARLETDRPGVIDTAKAHILAIAPEVTFTEVAMMSELVSRSIGGRGGNALLATISSAFGILALFFATIGVFGVVSHSVSARLREIGIRVALGADRRAVARLVMAQGIRLLVLGLSIGVLVAWTLTRGMGAMLFAVAPGDTLTYLGAALALGLAVLLACVSPMVQALRFDAASLFRAG